MDKQMNWVEKIIEDVNQEDGTIIFLFGEITNFLFKVLLFAGIPYMVYILLEFNSLL